MDEHTSTICSHIKEYIKLQKQKRKQFVLGLLLFATSHLYFSLPYHLNAAVDEMSLSVAAF